MYESTNDIKLFILAKINGQDAFEYVYINLSK